MQQVDGMDGVIDKATSHDQLALPKKLNTENIPSLEVPGLEDKMGNPLSSTGEHLGKVKAVPQNAINEVKSMDEVQKATQYFNEAEGVQQKAASYSKEVKAISKGNLDEVEQIPSAIEQKAQNFEQIQELQKQADEVGKSNKCPTNKNSSLSSTKIRSILKSRSKPNSLLFISVVEAEKQLDNYGRRCQIL